MLIGGSLLSAMFLAGCANDQDPPPDDDVDIENPADENGDMNSYDNGLLDDNNGNGDVNTDEDGDMMQDDNEPGEDIIEDQKDMNDEDNKDE